MKARVVLDTNILLVSLSSKSPYHWIFEMILSGEIGLELSTEIILEYEEIVSQYMGSKVAQAMQLTLKQCPFVFTTNVYYYWQLLNDTDDNKFVDCAIASGADFILTEDKDFNLLGEIPFPKVVTMNISNFQKWKKAH